MSRVEDFRRAAREQGFSDEQIEAKIAERRDKFVDTAKQQGFKDEEINAKLQEFGYTADNNTPIITENSTRWEQEKAQYGEDFYRRLHDKYSLMLESKEGREEAKQFFQNRYQATEDQINDFMSTLSPYTNDSTWRKYYRAGAEGLNEFLTGTALAINDFTKGTLGKIIGEDKIAELEKDSGDLAAIEAYSEQKYDRDWTDPRYYTSPEALRNVAAYALPYGASAKTVAKGLEAANVIKNTVPRVLAKGAMIAAPEAAIEYSVSRGTKSAEDAAVDATVAGASALALAGAGKAIVAGRNRLTGTKAANKYAQQLSDDPARFNQVQEALKLADEIGAKVTRDYIPSGMIDEAARASLRNVLFRSSGTKTSEYNNALLWANLMDDVNKLGELGNYSKLADEVNKIVAESKSPAAKTFDMIRTTYGHRDLNIDSEFQSALNKYLREGATGVTVKDFERITDYYTKSGYRNYLDGDEFVKKLRNKDTKDPYLMGINQVAKRDFAKMFEQHVMDKALPPEANQMLANARGAWGKVKAQEEELNKVAQAFSKENDEGRNLFPLSKSDSNYGSKIASLEALARTLDKGGRSELKEAIAGQYMKDRLARSLAEVRSMKEVDSPIVQVQKAFKNIDSKVLDIFLTPEQTKRFKSYHSLIQTFAEASKRYKHQGGTLGQVFDIVGYASAQGLVAPSSWLFTKWFNKPLNNKLLSAMDSIKKGNPKLALEKVKEALPEQTKSYYEQNSYKGLTGKQELRVSTDSSKTNSSELAPLAGLEGAASKVVSEQGDRVIDGSKVATMDLVRKFNPDASVKDAIASPTLLRHLKDNGFEALITKEDAQGNPLKVLDFGEATKFNPTVAVSQGTMPKNTVTEKLPENSFPKKVWKVSDLKQNTTPPKNVDLETADAMKAVEEKPPLEGAKKAKQEAKAKAEVIKKLDSISKKQAKLADTIEKQKDKTLKQAKYKEKFLIAVKDYAKRVKELKAEAIKRGAQEDWEQVVLANNTLWESLRQAEKDAAKAAAKEAKRQTTNAAKRQKTRMKNQSEEIMTETTNLEPQDYSRFVAENKDKYKSIDEMHEAYKAELAKPKPAESFTVTKKTQPEQPKQEKAKKPKTEPKVESKKEEPKVETKRAPKKAPKKEEPKVETEEAPKKEEPKVEPKKAPKKEEPKVETKKAPKKAPKKYAYSDASEPVPYSDKTPDAYTLPDLKELRRKGIDDEQAAIIQKALDNNEWEAGTSNRSEAVMALRIYKASKYKQDLIDNADPKKLTAEEWSKFSAGGMPKFEGMAQDFGKGEAGMLKQFYFRNLPDNEIKGLYYMVAKQPESYNKSHEEILNEAKDLFVKYKQKYSSASPESLPDSLRKRMSKGDDSWTGD